MMSLWDTTERVRWIGFGVDGLNAGGVESKGTIDF